MAKPKPSKYSRARIRSKVRKPKRGGSSRGWIISTVAIAIVGNLLVVLSYNDRQEESAVAPIANKDHWHAYLGVNICGTWEPAVPQFVGRDPAVVQLGPELRLQQRRQVQGVRQAGRAPVEGRQARRAVALEGRDRQPGRPPYRQRRDHRPVLRAQGHQARAAARLRRGPEVDQRPHPEPAAAGGGRRAVA